MVTFKKIIGRRIAAKRMAAGFASQAALADAIDVDRARISDWETGKREPKGKLKALLLETIKATEQEIFEVKAKSEGQTLSLATDVARQVVTALRSESSKYVSQSSALPLELQLAWAKLDPGTQNFLLYIATRDIKYLSTLSDSAQAKMVEVLKGFGDKPS